MSRSSPIYQYYEDAVGIDGVDEKLSCKICRKPISVRKIFISNFNAT